MDFIEQIFGFSPDAGDGSFELLLFAVPIILIVSVAAYRRAQSRSRARKR
jgi:hypothetical protein